jgi:type II secretory pathway predicted ATPase ExeA
MSKQLLSMYGMKWNPFSPDVPSEALLWTPRVEHFVQRVESVAREGGFVLVSGEVGAGKSIVMRLTSERLGQNSELCVRELSRPQARASDFYREMGDLFGVPLHPHNRWAGSKALRERWTAHIDSVRLRPVLLVDEAQEMLPGVLNELRLLASANLDARRLLTVVLCGDARLVSKLQTPDLLPIFSRIRTRLVVEPLPAKELAEQLRATLAAAGNPRLMTDELVGTLSEHAAGNWRALMNMSSELLAVAMLRELMQLDEKLYLEVFAAPQPQRQRRPAASGGQR